MNQELKKILILMVFLGGAVGLSLFNTGFLNSFSFVSLGNDEPLKRFASEILQGCSEKNYPPNCYDEEIPKLMDRGLSMEEVFRVTALVQQEDSNYFYCHILGHNISSKEASKDLSKWTEVIARTPSGICSNGAIHGAFQERFRDEVFVGNDLEELLPQLNTICENSDAKTFTGLEQASCYHAIGHLSMYVTGADIDEATSVVCDRVSRKGDADYTQTCYEGAFMQIFQPLEPEDFTLIEGIAPESAAEAQVFCDGFSGERKSACSRESWPLYRDTLQETSSLQAFCNLVPERGAIQRCYNAMFYVLTAQLNFDSEKIIPICEQLPENRRGQCFANSASRFIETDYRLADRAVGLCEVAKEYGVGNRCYEELLFYSTFNFRPDSEEFNTFCKILPEPWETKCLNKEGYNIRPGEFD